MAKKPGKLPKTIAGVKLPKKLRKTGGKLLATANSPRGRDVIASGLAWAAAAAATARAKAPTPPATPLAEGETAPSSAVIDPGQIVDALSAAAGAFMDGLFARKR